MFVGVFLFFLMDHQLFDEHDTVVYFLLIWFFSFVWLVCVVAAYKSIPEENGEHTTATRCARLLSWGFGGLAFYACSVATLDLICMRAI